MQGIYTCIEEEIRNLGTDGKGIKNIIIVNFGSHWRDKEYDKGSCVVKRVCQKSYTWEVCGPSRWKCQQVARKEKKQSPGAWEGGQG